jgi:DNA-binding NarL/FixJ family response regulator
VLQGFISKIKVKYADVVEVSLDVASEDGVADSGDLEADLPPLFVALGQAAATRNVPLALIFDELQYLHRKELGALVMAMHRVADDHDVVRSGLRHIVEAQPNWQVVAEAGNGKDAVQKALETKPDVAVIDYSLPLINGAEATRQIRSAQLRTEVLIFTMHDNETLIQDLLKAGARGYLLKSDARRHLIGAIEALAAHKPFFTAKVSEALLDSFLSRPAPEGSVLTHRERGVVQLVAEGYSNKQIASLLEIGLKTVETHRAAIMRKLNLASTAALVRYAIRNQIVQP